MQSYILTILFGRAPVRFRSLGLFSQVVGLTRAAGAAGAQTHKRADVYARKRAP